MWWAQVSRKGLVGFEVYPFVGGLPIGTYTEIVNAASEAATLAALRALQSGALNLSRSVPAPNDTPSSDGNESETGALQPFKRMRLSVFLRLCDVTFFPAPPGKKRVPRSNQDKLVDVC